MALSYQSVTSGSSVPPVIVVGTQSVSIGATVTVDGVTVMATTGSD